MGDPAGVGPEVILRTFAVADAWTGIRPLVFGDLTRLKATADRFDIPVEPVAVKTPKDAAGQYPLLDVIDLANISPDLPLGAGSAVTGRAALDYIEAAAAAVMAGDAAALVTAPISKEAIRAAGSPYSGHTDMLAAMTKTDKWAMTLVAENMRAMFVTAHIPIRDVSAAVTTARVLETIELADMALGLLGEPDRTIAVAGLNPHAGEAGILGSEETDRIIPAIAAAREKGINCAGPVPGDTVFYRMQKGEFAIVVAMYHDQGHAPLKLIAFDTGVNWTVGLPIIRTSPDHGTAFDIAAKGVARPDSFHNALALAARLARNSGQPK
jgi:4-hydroxythreonine-4-phosphate dehydrogenase